MRLTAFWCVPALIGALLVLFATRQGIGVSNDSVLYLDAAQHVLRGDGMVVFTAAGPRPLTHFPPLYPAVLAGVGALGLGVQRAAVLVGATLFTSLIVSIGCLTWRMSGSIVGSIVAEFVVAHAPSILEIYAMAWSEGLFLILAIWSLAITAEYLKTHRSRDFVLALCLAALASLTRYAGLALVGTIAVALLLDNRRSWRQLSKEIGTGLLVLGATFGFWMLRNLYVAGNTTNRSLALHPIGSLHVSVAVATVFRWLVPFPDWSTPASSIEIVLAVVLCTLTFTILQRANSDRERLPAVDSLRRLLTLFAFTYAGFLVFSISLVDASTPPDARILSPEYVVLVLLTTSALASLALRNSSNRLARIALTTLSSFVLVQDVVVSWNWAINARERGLGFNSPRRKADVAELSSVATRASPIVISNCPELVYFVTGVRAVLLPTTRNVTSHIWNPHVTSDLSRLRAEMRAGAVVLYFPEFQPPYMVKPAELSGLHIEPIAANSSGMAFRSIPAAGEAEARQAK